MTHSNDTHTLGQGNASLFSPPSRQAQWILGFLLLVALFLRLGDCGFFMEEPRRALVGLEMESNDNLWVPTQMGELYFKKPPVFNWVLLGAFHLLGYNEFAARTVSVLSLLGMGLLTFLFLKKYHSRELAGWAALFTVLGGDIFFSGSMLAEIDLFYSLITYASFLAIYHFHRQQQYWLLFLTVYALGAIGTLTKGLPSPVFLFCSLLAFFIWKREFWKLFSLAHFAGIGLWAIILVGYYWKYAEQGDLMGVWNGLWSQSSDRTVIKTGIGPMILHLVTFPFVVLKDILPAGLFVILAIFKPQQFKNVWRQDVLRFVAIIFLANILIYWISPGTRSRYTYMMLPLPTIFLVALYLKAAPETKWLAKALWWIGRVAGGLLVLGGLAVFHPALQPHLTYLGWGIIVASVLAVGAFLWQFWHPQSALMTLAITLIIARIWFDAYIIPMRDTTQIAGQTRRDGIKVGQLTQGKPLYLWLEQHDGSVSLATVFYIERERRQTLGMTNDRHCGAYYVGHARDTVGLHVKPYYHWDYKVDHFVLFTFPDCDTLPHAATDE